MKPIIAERANDSFTYADVAENIYGINPPIVLIQNLTFLGGFVGKKSSE